MKCNKIYILFFLLIQNFNLLAQQNADIFYKNAVKANRDNDYNNIINTITKNLSQPIADSTEYDWEDAFAYMELINYKQPWVNQKIKTAFDNIQNRSDGFIKTIIEAIYALQISQFSNKVYQLLQQTTNAKIFAMCAEYLFTQKKTNAPFAQITMLATKMIATTTNKKDHAILNILLQRVIELSTKKTEYAINKDVFKKEYLKGNVIVYSIQRKNRNYPGIVFVKDTAGNFITTQTKKIFYVPQLARSITNLPSYLTNGNTPQGFFKMDKFAVSKIGDIGPTQNIQLTMPFETSIKHFLNDSTIKDTTWTIDLYKKLLPNNKTIYYPLFQSFEASEAGRTEIIAHGTTVNINYYKGQTYYPHTPTQGCLCTKEIWSTVDGKRLESNQQKLINAVKKAGGANGYLIVIEINDKQMPVSIDEILPFIQ